MPQNTTLKPSRSTSVRIVTSAILSRSKEADPSKGAARAPTANGLAEGAGQLRDVGDGGGAVRRVRGGVVAGGRGGMPPRSGVKRRPKGPVSFEMAVMAAKPPGGAGATLWRAGEGGQAPDSSEGRIDCIGTMPRTKG